jgi:hypothetical protein
MDSPLPRRPAEYNYFVHICLRMISLNEAEQSRLAGSIRAEQRPALTRADCPVKIAEDILSPYSTVTLRSSISFFAEPSEDALQFWKR